MENQEKYNNLSKLVEKLKKSEDPKRKYEYILWLGKKLKEPHSDILVEENKVCLLYTSPSPRDRQKSRMPSSA